MTLQISARTSALFHNVIDAFQNEEELEKLMDSAQLYFYMKPFKIRKIGWNQAKYCYMKLAKKYEKKELPILTLEWHKNERKIFIWFLICYWKVHKAQFDSLPDTAWEEIAVTFFYKDPLFVKFQGLNIMKNQKKINWTAEDDADLVQFVEQFKTGNWNQISKAIFFKNRMAKFISPKHCRERWFNHKSTDVVKSQWKIEEDYSLLYFCQKVGRKWSKFARIQNNKRTEHMIKNRYFCLVNKISKKANNEQEVLQYALRKSGENLPTQERYELERQLDLKIQRYKSKRFCPKSKSAKKIGQPSSGDKEEHETPKSIQNQANQEKQNQMDDKPLTQKEEGEEESQEEREDKNEQGYYGYGYDYPYPYHPSQYYHPSMMNYYPPMYDENYYEWYQKEMQKSWKNQYNNSGEVVKVEKNNTIKQEQ